MEYTSVKNPKWTSDEKTSIECIVNFNNIGETPFTMRDYFRFTGGLRGGMQGSGTSFNIESGGLGFMTVQNKKTQKIISKF